MEKSVYSKGFTFFVGTPSPEQLAKAQEMIGSNKEFAMNVAPEMTPVGPANSFVLESKDKRLSIILRQDSVNLEMRGFKPNEEPNDVFIPEILKLLKHFSNAKGTRVAIRTVELYPDPPKSIEQRVASKWFGAETPNPPQELGFKINSRYALANHPDETINSIRMLDFATITLRSGDGQRVAIQPAISLRSDTNTIFENNQPRFEAESLQGLIVELLKEDDKALGYLRRFLDE